MIGSGKEYASLEGIMGGHYARRAGESDAVAAAIAEHYLPRGASDEPPFSAAGALLSLADKLDHVAGAFVARQSSKRLGRPVRCAPRREWRDPHPDRARLVARPARRRDGGDASVFRGRP